MTEHADKKAEEVVADDQGMVFGYATDEWDKESLHPLSHLLANKICEALAEARKTGEMVWLRPNCKTQVVVLYKREGNRIAPV